MTNKTPIAIHVIGCLLFLLLPALFSPHSLFSAESYLTPYAWRDFLTYGLLIFFFYLNYYILLPRYYFEKSYGDYAFLLVPHLRHRRLLRGQVRSRARPRCSIRTPAPSRPTESRTRPGVMPRASRSASGTTACVIDAGCWM